MNPAPDQGSSVPDGPPPPMALPMGYEGFSLGNSLPPPPLNVQFAMPTFEPPKLKIGPSEEEVRASLMKLAQTNYCWGTGAAKESTFTEIKPSNAFHYVLESWSEGRKTDWEHEPFRGQMIDGPERGPPPHPWEIPAQPPAPHTEAKVKLEIPHTASVIPCYKCQASGRVICGSCSGQGRSTCFMCHGSGHTTHMQSSIRDGQAHTETVTSTCHHCSGSGRVICSPCSGSGRVTCPKCVGAMRLKAFLELTVKWENHVSNCVVDRSGGLPAELVQAGVGDTVFEFGAPRVPPVNFFQDPDVNTGSARLVQEHATAWPQERMLLQRHKIRQVPIARVESKFKDKQYKFFVYGKDLQCYAPEYPQQCCGGCTML